MAGIHFFIHLASEPGSKIDRLRRADWVGIVVLTGSLIALLYGITSGGVLHAWSSGAVIASIVVGLSGIAVFSVYEELWAKEPIIPLRIFKNRTAGVAYVGTFVLGFVLWAMQYYLILYVSSPTFTAVRQQSDHLNTVSCHKRTFPARIWSIYPSGNTLYTCVCCRWRLHYLKAAEVSNCQLCLMAFGDSWLLTHDSTKD
jgi:hypothetical protein